MNGPVKVAMFALGLAALFAASLGAGRLVGPTGAAEAGDHATGHETPAGPGSPLPGGLQVAQDGYRLELLTPAVTAGGEAQSLRLRVIGPDGAPVESYVPTHDKELHLIVVRRDLSSFQHLHPTLGDDGVWEIPLRTPAAGQYRVFADFQPAGRDEPLTLGVDLPAPGDYQPIPLPMPARTSTVDGYTVTLEGELTPGGSSRLSFTVSRDGVPVTDLAPYLAAYGHLVALRDGDLAYLHVHPDGAPGDGRTAPGPTIVFHAEAPSAGAYRLFLDFQHNGVVRTASFTVVVGQADVAPAPSGSADQHGGHG